MELCLSSHPLFGAMKRQLRQRQVLLREKFEEIFSIWATRPDVRDQID
jgi:hypothetical protein